MFEVSHCHIFASENVQERQMKTPPRLRGKGFLFLDDFQFEFRP